MNKGKTLLDRIAPLLTAALTVSIAPRVIDRRGMVDPGTAGMMSPVARHIL